MKYKGSVFSLGIAILFALPVFPQAKPPAPAAGKAQKEVEPPPVLSVPPGYEYTTGGRRDPFLNPIPKEEAQEAAAAPPVVRPPGLPGLLLAETRLNGIITSREPGMTKAVIGGPGRKTYFASRGDVLFDAVIKEIRADAVVFTVVSPTTKQSTDREIVRSVSNPAGENK